MLVEIRPTAQCHGKNAHGKNAVDLSTALAPVFDTLSAHAAEGADLSRLRVVADWVQYRENFRAPVELRPVVGSGQQELALDLRRTAAADADEVATAVGTALHAHRSGGGSRDHVTLEEWGPTRRSRIWEFNSLYWQHLRRWEEATGRGYESALPGGQSDARGVAPVRADHRRAVRDLGRAGAAPCVARRSSTWWSSASATVVRPGPGWTPSSRWTANTAATTTGGCTT